MWVRATGLSQGLESRFERANFFPAAVAGSSPPPCSARVLLPSCGGVEVAGFRRREQEAVTGSLSGKTAKRGSVRVLRTHLR